MKRITNITLIQVKLGSDPLSKVLGSNLVGENNVVRRRDSPKGGQSGFSAEISN